MPSSELFCPKTGSESNKISRARTCFFILFLYNSTLKWFSIAESKYNDNSENGLKIPGKQLLRLISPVQPPHQLFADGFEEMLPFQPEQVDMELFLTGR